MRPDLGLAATMLSRADPRTIQAVLSCGRRNCSSVTKAMEHFQTLYQTAGAEGAAKSILCRVGHCVSICAETWEFEAEDSKPKPGGIPLASFSWGQARRVLSTGGRSQGPRSEMSDVSGFHVKDVMDMDQDELIQKYNRTLRAAGLLRYMLEADDGLTEEPEQKMWTLVRQAEYQEFQSWKRHKVWCCLRDAHDTRCLLHRRCRPLCLLCALRTFPVMSPDLPLVTITVFAALNMHSMSHAMPLQLPPPQYPPQYPVRYQPPQYGQQYGQYGQRYGQLYGQQPQYQEEEWEEPGMKAEWQPDRIPPPPPPYYQQHHAPPPPPQQQQLHPPPLPPQEQLQQPPPWCPRKPARWTTCRSSRRRWKNERWTLANQVTGACRALYLFRTLSSVVSLAPSLGVPKILHALRAVPRHVPGDGLHVVHVLHVLHSC